MKNIGVILAGGSGRRLGSELPKQFIIIAGKTVLAHTLTTFEGNEHIDEIVKERYHSTLAALNAYPNEKCKFIIHDAVRLLVTRQMIDDTIEALDHYPACTTAIPSTDTILQSDTSGQFVNKIPDRSTLFQVQTPQGFLVETLREAYNQALTDPHFFSTDDCGVVKRYLPDTVIKIIEGSPSNVKLTYKEDISIIEGRL